MKSEFFRLIVLASVTFLIVSCSSGDSATEKPEQVISVNVEVVKPTSVQVSRTFTGSLLGEKQAEIYAKIAEAVDNVYVKEGDVVKAGQVLLSLDKTGPTSDYLRTQSVHLNAEKNYHKMEFLFKEGAVSETSFDEAKTNYEVSKAAFEAASKLVDIVSPIDGIVTSLNASDGDFTQVGQKLATVATTGKLRVKFPVNAADVDFFSTATKLTVAADEIAQPVEAKVTTVASSANPQTRTFEIEAIIVNNESQFKPGMFVRVNLIQETLSDVVMAPRKAVVTLNDIPTIFVAEGGRAVRRPVELGADINGHIVIKSGLRTNDSLVVLGQDYLEDGFKVNVTSVNEG